jgi:phosphoglycolate phosphatase-like HAD superfamily hydrolase
MQALEKYLKNHPKKEIIFDLDGTLFFLDIDWSQFKLRLWSLVAKLDNQLAGQVPIGQHGTANILINKAVAKYGQKAKKIIFPFNQKFELDYFRGARENKPLTEFIKKFYQQFNFYLWTSNFSTTIQPLLTKSNLTTCFKKIITHDDVNLIKPDPEGFYLINSAKKAKSDFLLVGNDDNDRLASHAAGIDFFNI